IRASLEASRKRPSSEKDCRYRSRRAQFRRDLVCGHSCAPIFIQVRSMTQLSALLIFRLIVLCAVLGVAAALAFGYLGWIHPAFVAFSRCRTRLAMLLLIAVPVLALLPFWPELLFAALLATSSIVSTTGLPWLSPLPSANASNTAAG